jgi:hypothetical protein
VEEPALAGVAPQRERNLSLAPRGRLSLPGNHVGLTRALAHADSGLVRVKNVLHSNAYRWGFAAGRSQVALMTSPTVRQQA